MDTKSQEIFDNANDAIYYHALTDDGMPGPFVEVNRKACEMLGYSEDEFLQMTPVDIDAEEKHGALPQIMSTLMTEGHATFEMMHQAKDGSKIPVEISSHLSTVEGERRVLSIARDITEHKQKQQALAESEERYRRLFETAQDGMLILEAETGEIIDSNPYIKKILGYRKDELVGRHLWQIGTFRHIAENKERFRELVQEGYIRYEDLPMKIKNGGEAAVEFVSNTYEAGEKNVVQCNIRDVTQRKKAEAHREQLISDLRERVKEINCLYAVAGLAVDSNTSEEELLAGAVEEIPSGWQHPEKICARIKYEGRVFASSEFRETPRKQSAKLTVSGKTTGVVEVFYLEEMSEADEGPFLTEERELLDNLARQLGIALSAKRIQNKLQKALEELQSTQQQVIEQERQRALTTMASGIAHDFNNALAPILGFSDLLLTDPQSREDPEELFNYLENIRNAAKKAAATVRRMRNFYRSREETSFAPLDLNKVIEEAISVTEPRWRQEAQASGRDIEIKTEPGDIGNISGNEAELHEMLVNLIFNAVDAMPEGGVITIRTSLEDGEAVLEVSDTGAGMSEETKERCFVPFYSTKGSNGTGLGLATLHGTVERHLGKIDVFSEEGQGSTFRIVLPVSPAVQTERESPAPTEMPVMRILIVEDEEIQRDLLRKLLETDGHSVDSAPNGRKALQKFNANGYDMVFTDRAMPGMSGDQVAAKIKEAIPDEPVIMLTGFGDMMDASGEKCEAVDKVVSKPVTKKKLQLAIAETLKDLS